jgi:hypothetical protein
LQNKRAATLDLTEEPVNKKVELCNSTPDKAEQPVVSADECYVLPNCVGDGIAYLVH